MSEDVQWMHYKQRFNTYGELIQVMPPDDLDMIICIPAFAEPALTDTLKSLAACFIPEGFSIEVIILFNTHIQMSEAEEKIHERSIMDCLAYIASLTSPQIQMHAVNLDSCPDPKGGVGWARKLAMDEAARRLRQDGIIACLDADCTVEANYVAEIHKAFSNFPRHEAASIYFEHPFTNLSDDEKNTIIAYELHLRYLVHAQRWCGHPFAYQTVGSSMAVRRNSYLAQGGMNTRRAGEDFYFLQKFIENDRLFEISTTTVYPSARVSQRVPFGTGRAMLSMLPEGQQWLTTDFSIFESIRPLFSLLMDVWDNGEMIVDYGLLNKESNLDGKLVAYLEKIDFLTEVRSIRKQTSSFENFRKRFFRFLNAFSMIRYMHDMRDHYFPDIPVTQAVTSFYKAADWSVPGNGTTEDFLIDLRFRDKQ